MAKQINLKNTLNLPRTEFQMKAELAKREPEFIQKWDRNKIYEKLRKLRSDNPIFVLHDGPPYANGKIHMGTALNKILKDIVVKSYSMMGYNTPYLPGWDCHGLPIEHEVDKQLGEKKKSMSKIEIRKLCKQFALKFVDIQREEFKRLGVLGEWEKPYLTLDYTYEKIVIQLLSDFAAKGSLYKGYRPVHWCIHCKTALAEAEVEYMDHESYSIYIKFPVKSDLSKKIPALAHKKVFVIIWTTTPWTIPANLAIAFHSHIDYVAFESNGEVYITAKALMQETVKKCNLSSTKILAEFKGDALEGLYCQHPYLDRDSLLVLGDYVTIEQGTGCVHTAPGHGMDDYLTGLKYKLDIYTPVDEEGNFTRDVPLFAGMNVFDANEKINQHLAAKEKLLCQESIVHSYPHCWRCKNPVIFRATEQWFISMEKEGLRQKALDEINRVEWIPSWGKERIFGMVENRPDWCISRQRIWGVPIPIFYCQNCKKPLIDPNIINYVADIFGKEGSDAWFLKDVKELKPPDIDCPHCGGKEFFKETDIMDVWFESGASHAAVLGQRKDLPWPSNIYLEGSDQYRGWFHSSLLIAVNSCNRAPYDLVITHGFIVDGEGRKMSKSLGNIITPQEIIDQNGAEIIRLWVAMMDYREDMRISNEILSRIIEAYRKIRNTCRFMLGNLYDFNPDKDSIPFDALLDMDRWAINNFNKLALRVVKAYKDYEYHIVYHSLNSFSTVDMSSFYLDIIKDRLYISHAQSKARRSAQTTLHYILNGLTRLMAPILSFTAEEIWSFLKAMNEREESVHLATFFNIEEKLDKELLSRWNKVIKLREEVNKALEIARNEKIIGHSLDANVILSADKKYWESFGELINDFSSLFIVSKVSFQASLEQATFNSEEILGLSIKIEKAPGEKCERCWHYCPTVGDDEEYPSICSRCKKVLEELKLV
jgi:isoleucyl-tRNA synthetase